MEEQEEGEPTQASDVGWSRMDEQLPLKCFIFPDIRALSNIHLQQYSDLVFTEVAVTGFEIYIVEQWVAERKLSTVITSYTGSSQDTVSAVQVVLPSDYGRWPPGLKNYYNEIMEYSQPKSTSKGTLFITNLFNVSSTLNLLHVQCGDLRRIWSNFKINFDLKRLHCGGRSALLLNAPSTAAEDKFSQLYKIPVNNSLRPQAVEHSGDAATDLANDLKGYHPVVELITLVQMCLSYFKLASKTSTYEGLVYDETKTSVDQWWEQYGKLYLGTEKPKNEASLGPSTIAALISMVLSCYLKLLTADCLSSKDPFDDEEFRSGIFTFQKKYSITKKNGVSYLDHQTLEKLFEVSAKTSNSDIYKFKKVVKSTVHDITGKGNTPRLSNEILTTDIDVLAKSVTGGSLGFLWKGKGRPRKGLRKATYKDFVSIVYNRGDPEEYLKSQKESWNARKAAVDAALAAGTAISIGTSKKAGPSTAEKAGEDTVQSDILDDENSVTNTGLQRYNSSASSVSVSSMVCNYDRGKYIQSYGINKVYLGEYYRRNSVSCFCEEDSTPNCAVKLHRSASISRIQEVVEPWNLPFDPSLVRMARDLLRMQGQLNAEQQKERDLTNLPVEEIKFEQLKTKLQDTYEKYSNNAKVFDKKHEDIENRKELVLSEMRELESLSSKLKYNIRILERRMREVEDSVEQFEKKLQKVENTFLTENLGFCGEDLKDIGEDPKFEEKIRRLLQSKKKRYECMTIKVINKYFGVPYQKDFIAWTKWVLQTIFGKQDGCI